MGRKKCCSCEANSLEYSYRTFFKVPGRDKLGHLFESWKNFIGEAYYTDQSEIYICEIHFESNQIVKGKSRKSLVVGAIPSLSNRDQEIDLLIDQNTQYASPSFKPRTKIIHFHDIVSECENIIQSHDNIYFKRLNDGLILYLLNLEPPFNTLFQIYIDKDKKAKIFSGNGTLDMLNFKDFFSKPYVLVSTQEFKNLIFNLSNSEPQFNETDFENLRGKYECNDLVNFFEEQLSLSVLPGTKRRYSNDLIIFSYSLYIKSASLYSDLAIFFYLPSIRLFRRCTQPINKSLKDDDSNYCFLDQQYQALKPHERLVTLKLDEVQIKPKLEYRSGELTGFAANRNGEPAKHVQAFMIQSVLSKYSEMVQLIPVSRNDTNFLLKLFTEVVSNLEYIGFEILCATYV